LLTFSLLAVAAVAVTVKRAAAAAAVCWHQTVFISLLDH
jgi:hypothetical protein